MTLKDGSVAEWNERLLLALPIASGECCSVRLSICPEQSPKVLGWMLHDQSKHGLLSMDIAKASAYAASEVSLQWS